MQFKYKWAVQKTLGTPTPGVHTFSIICNISHFGKTPGAVPRWNMEYQRWVAELQLEHLLAMKRAVTCFPARPFSRRHPLHGVVHPLSDWVPHAPAITAVNDAVADVDSDDSYDDDDDEERSDEGSDEGSNCPPYS